jgi:hypothetical protein
MTTRMLAAVAVAVGLAAGARAADPARTKAAEELLVAMKADKTLDDTIAQMLDAQAKQNPMIVKFRPAMEKFFRKHMSWDALKGEMAALYAEEFTADELAELTKFYKTPLGQKIAEKTPKLAAKGAELGIARVQKNQDELKRMIEEELKK